MSTYSRRSLYRIEDVALNSVSGVSRRVFIRALSASALALPAIAQTEQRPVDTRDPLEVVFSDSIGRSYTVHDFRGRPVLVSLWASWCTPCLIELPALDRLQRDEPELVVLAISQDREGVVVASTTFERARINFLKLFVDSDGALFNAFSAEAIPFSVIIDSSGEILSRRRGIVHWDSSVERDFLRQVLGSI